MLCWQEPLYVYKIGHGHISEWVFICLVNSQLVEFGTTYKDVYCETL